MIFILAFGGGSVIDFAKLYKYFSQSPAPLLAIPTTAGTGSEATQFAVVYADGVKQSIDDVSILPTYSIIDSQFLLGSPQYLKACSSIDAFCQAIESFCTKQSRDYAIQSIILSRDHLVNFVNSDQRKAHDMMSHAAHLAGKAINISRTTAPHALSYTFTSLYDVPHGHAVALSLAQVFEANLRIDEETCQDIRGVQFVKEQMLHILSILNIDDFSAYWNDLMKSIRLSMDYSRFRTELIVGGVNKERLKNNPKNLVNDLQYFWQDKKSIADSKA